jgi:hypothetical protein
VSGVHHLQVKEREQKPDEAGLFTSIFDNRRSPPDTETCTTLKYNGARPLAGLSVGTRVYCLTPGQEITVPDRFAADIVAAYPGRFAVVRAGEAAVIDFRFK